MLFNSYGFLFLYLPLVLTGFFVIARVGKPYAAAWLAAASLFFYGWWNPVFVLLLLASILFNYTVGAGLARSGSFKRKGLLVAAICANLGLLGYFKYANFFLGAANHLTGWNLPLNDVLLPLGISFFTFTQIAFLVDVYRGLAREFNLVHYVLFVTYFPHLIAGPVLHHKQMMPQFRRAETYKFSGDCAILGVAVFTLGLAKKVLLADSLAELADPVFEAAGHGQAPMFASAWTGALAYALQLYFDFSGYSDMAIGLSLMFGVKLPINFNSPYKALNIIEFWRCWHMTLSQFLRDYLYIALGGNRRGPLWRHINLMVTMVLGGLWHGASWTFVAWGALHGLFLVINHGWIACKGRLVWLNNFPAWSRRLFAAGLTFVCVLVAWVLFRAERFEVAQTMFAGMLGLNGVSLPQGLDFAPLRDLGWIFLGFFADNEKLQALGVGSGLQVIAVALFIVWVCPNTQQFLGYQEATQPTGSTEQTKARLAWRPKVGTAVWLGLLFGACLVSFSKASPFLYFQF
jgi:alginate O-acetyltransferase complex protein AlgI